MYIRNQRKLGDLLRSSSFALMYMAWLFTWYHVYMIRCHNRSCEIEAEEMEAFLCVMPMLSNSKCNNKSQLWYIYRFIRAFRKATKRIKARHVKDFF